MICARSKAFVDNVDHRPCLAALQAAQDIFVAELFADAVKFGNNRTNYADHIVLLCRQHKTRSWQSCLLMP